MIRIKSQSWKKRDLIRITESRIVIRTQPYCNDNNKQKRPKCGELKKKLQMPSYDYSKYFTLFSFESVASHKSTKMKIREQLTWMRLLTPFFCLSFSRSSKKTT